MLRRILKILAGVVVTAIVLAIAVFIATGPKRPDADSASAAWLQAGPYRVAQTDITFVDASRPTAENRGEPGHPDRTLVTTIWYPEQYQGDMPLIIHSHGILSSRLEMPYLMEALASHGYVVAAADYPLTNGATPGGANANDVINQPADISFLIDSILGLSDAEKPFAGNIDTARIGLSGYSLGGLTTYLATFHPQLRDPRVRAAVAIAGPSAPFSSLFFASSDAPVLAIAGTADALIEYRRNAADLPERADDVTVVGITGGSHLGFVGAADPTFRFMHNPDSLGCSAVMAALGENPNEAFEILGTPDQGVDMSRDLPDICGDENYAEAVHPGEQHMITQVAALSFFESVFDPDPATRQEAHDVLTRELDRDFSQASVSGN